VIMMKTFKSVSQNIPLVSGLLECKRRDHWYALQEFFVIIIFSTVPIWVGGFVVYLSSKLSKMTYIESIIINISNGELFLYSAAILAPIFYIALIDYPGTKIFPNRLSHIGSIVIVLVLSSVAFGLQRMGIKLLDSLIFKTSCIFFIITLVFFYIALVYKNRRFPDISEEIKNGENKFTENYLKHR